jgi:protein Tex
MNVFYFEKIARELDISPSQVQATAQLIGEAATVPFIARYRKEMTGSLDEVAVTAIRDRLVQLEELDSRREAIVKSLTERNLLTDELKVKIEAAETLAVLEDIYLPFRPKRRTRATIAREKGLEPLAAALFAQGDMDVQAEAARYVDAEKGVADAEEALAGARDIMAEWINENQDVRTAVRALFFEKGTIRTRVITGKEEEGIKYKDYYDWEEPIATAQAHRVLAMRRGEQEEFLILRMSPPEDDALKILEGIFVRGDAESSRQVRLAAHDGYRRLLASSMETEVRLATKKAADDTSIKVFAENLRQLLLAPPLGQKAVLAIDPGFRTGCKVVCLDRQGKLLHNETIYPLLSDRSRQEAALTVAARLTRFTVEAVAVGNGTGGRETEAFLRTVDIPKTVPIVMVNESGASVYSASQAARDEFPDQDVTVRGAVSIGRRLMDPLAELVKIDPKAIGVGQYQHDVDQTALKQCLDDVVVSCVNAVGVEVNTASAQLLSYVSGLGPALADNIVKHRNATGPFGSRTELLKVHRLGPKAFEQAAGFIRIRDGLHPLDASSVHPESYGIVERMAADQECSITDLMQDEARRQQIRLSDYVSDQVGLPTLKDIMNELAKPGRDPRQQFQNVVFAEGIEKIGDVTPGMKLPGIVTNITAFGAFVDIGVHQDGLVHLSEMADRFVKAPGEVVKVGQKVDVTVLNVDLARSRIGLSLKKSPGQKNRPDASSDTTSATPATQGKRQERKAEKKPAREAPRPFNNPFADAFRKQGKP